MSSGLPSRDVVPGRSSRPTGRCAGWGAVVWGWCLAAGLLIYPIPALARGPGPTVRIPLEPLGFNTISNRYLLEGATMLTVNYVDNSHLLVTFGVSRLMKRLADCPAEDEDRLIKAVVLELPTGKEIAETEWRFHDLGQYLWELGGGTFLLRQRAVLSTFTPLEGAGEAFELHPFLKFDRRIEAIAVSAGHDLLTIETVKRTPSKAESAPVMTAAGGSQPSATAAHGLVLQRRDGPPDQEEPKPEPTPVEISLVRLEHRPSSSGRAGPDHITATLSGRIRTKDVVNIPLTTEGFLETKGTTRDGVLFDFTTFTGKVLELGDFATSCAPKPTFVSPSEFVAFGCRGSDDSLDLAGFNLRGDLIWQMNFSDIQAYPSFQAAIPAGRFALSRTLTMSNIFGSETPSMSELTGQEVRVVQMYNGKLLLKVMTSPIQRSGQNFALSPDGMSLAIVHDNTTVKGSDLAEDTIHDPAIEIYRLPPLSAKDEKEIAAEAALAPEPANARMRFSIEEIKAALARKPGAASDETAGSEDSAESRRVTQADMRVVGDAVPVTAKSKAQSETGSIPSPVAPPLCAVANDSQVLGCPVRAKPQPAEGIQEGDADHPRKPPTLYAPGEAHEPAPTTPQSQ